MIDPEFFYTVAQVGVTYAGFSTLVAVVAYRNDSGALPARIYYMLLLSIIVIAFALLPTVIGAFGVEERNLWRLSSALYGITWSVYWVNAIITIRKRFRIWGSINLVNKINTAVVHPVSTTLLILGALGVWSEWTDAVYITALFIMLYMSAHLFLQIIVDLMNRQGD